jgi:hypothetical protein
MNVRELPENMPTKQGGKAQTPDQIYADITRQQYDDFIKNFGGLESSLIARSNNDTSLIDKARVDSGKAAGIATGIADRNASRYGVGMTPDMLQARNANIQHSSALGSSDAINNAQLAQYDANMSLQDKLIDIGLGVNTSALSGLGTVANLGTQRDTAYNNAKAQSKINMWGTIGSIGSKIASTF